jgi:hypothetical protein
MTNPSSKTTSSSRRLPTEAEGQTASARNQHRTMVWSLRKGAAIEIRKPGRESDAAVLSQARWSNH